MLKFFQLFAYISAYLDNYVCLEDNADHYEKCHNDSQLSQEYLSTITERADAIYARCW